MAISKTKIVKRTFLAVATLAVTAFLTVNNAFAKEFKITASSSHPPVVPWVSVIKNYVVPEASKRAKALGHNIKWTEAYAGALYNFKNTLEGIEDGLGDIGWVGTLWEPNKLPLHNATFYLPFVSGDVMAAAEIASEMHDSIPAMKKALLKHNQIFLGAQTIDDYVLISKTPIKTVADLKGKKFYAPGASAQWLKGTGAVAVNGGLPVYYNGIKTGVADGAIVPGTGIFPFKLHEAAPYVINVGLGGGSVYSVELIDAFPTTIGQVELNNELDGLVQINVQLSYTNWQRASGGQRWIQASAGLGSLSQFLG